LHDHKWGQRFDTSTLFLLFGNRVIESITLFEKLVNNNFPASCSLVSFIGVNSYIEFCNMSFSGAHDETVTSYDSDDTFNSMDCKVTNRAIGHPSVGGPHSGLRRAAALGMDVSYGVENQAKSHEIEIARLPSILSVASLKQNFTKIIRKKRTRKSRGKIELDLRVFDEEDLTLAAATNDAIRFLSTDRSLVNTLGMAAEPTSNFTPPRERIKDAARQCSPLHGPVTLDLILEDTPDQRSLDYQMNSNYAMNGSTINPVDPVVQTLPSLRQRRVEHTSDEEMGDTIVTPDVDPESETHPSWIDTCCPASF
jgi:hypothetical protein